MTLTAARSDVYMELGINKRHFQTSGNVVRFDHGELNLYLRDGNIGLAACTSDPQLYFYGPHLGCPSGITGYVAWGDFNRDGVSDANQYWSIERVVPALVIAPNFPGLCSLVSAPPSKLPRPLRIFRDGAVTVFHDLRTSEVTQYNIALYEMIRRYGSVRQVETVVAAGAVGAQITDPEDGTLVVRVSGLDFPAPVEVPVAISLEIEEGVLVPMFAEEWAENVRVALQNDPQISAVYSVGGTGNSITLTEITPNGNDPTLLVEILGSESHAGATYTTVSLPISSLNTVQGTVVKSPAAALKQMNEELVNGRYVFAFPSRLNPTTQPVNMPVTIVPNVEALGSNPRVKGGFVFTSGTFDEGNYQIDPRIISPISWTGNDPATLVPGDQLYFSILTPSEDRLAFPPTIPQAPVRLSTPAVQGYTLPPGFFDVGQEGVIDVRYQRTLKVTPTTWDRSKREFRMRVNFVDTYPGYAQGAFPLGTAGDVTPVGDFDRDGMTNAEEYAYQFPTNAAINAAARLQFEPQLGFENGVLTIEEFSRVIEQVPEPIADEVLQPDGVVGPTLDESNRVVLRVPYRAHTGSSLRYEFVEETENNKGKKKSKKIKPGARWEIFYEDGESDTRSVHVEVRGVDPTTREVYFIRTRAAAMNVTTTHKYIILRSVQPVNPADPLPNIAVKLTPLDVR